jgi:hypothetical protein
MARLPFRMHPSSWGKKGRDFELAKANYELEGETLAEEITKVNNKWDKEDATKREEPWVSVIDVGVNPDDVSQGYFELDWNEEFVRMLQSAGITGTSDEDVVNKWFNSICRSVLLQAGADQDYGLQEVDPREQS